MTEPTVSSQPPAEPVRARGSLALRQPIPRWQALLLGVVCLASCGLLWWVATLGPGEERLVGPLILPSPAETFGKFPSLWFEEAFARNLFATLWRVAMGFSLAVMIGVPLGVLAGCFPRVYAFLAPLIAFGRNIPVAALVPLVIFAVNYDFIFSRGENRKIMFIFIACVAFVLADTARAIMDVSERYVDTAFTLGASRWQTIIKVLVPLAMPTVFSSCRLMFGIAFGYIMLAEITREPDTLGGVGFQINTFQRIGSREEVYLIILIVPLVALVVDQFLYWVQRQMFP
ncbi:MAG TPA: ABC transporter permease subunit, partial [Pirellulaceae bacterium]|nr:ABC transporter permease subunit [Pirellulaceae bacterium]